jgi:hypothetical protein
MAGDKLIFRTRAQQLSDVNEVVESLESLLAESLIWSTKQDDSAQLCAFASVVSIKLFLNQSDLLYKDWCTPQVLEEAEVIRQNLPIQIKE